MSPRGLPAVVLGAGLTAGGCCQCAPCEEMGSASGGATAGQLELVEAFPHVRVDRNARVVEFDARVTPLMHFEDTPVMWLEVLVTTPDTKPHETLLVTGAKPSHVHAALLLAGLEPGEPGRVWVDEGGVLRREPAKGAPVSVRFLYEDPASGGARTIDPREWTMNSVDGRRLGETGGGGFVFAGSAFRAVGGREAYVGDLDGTLVGLVTFGSETVAWSEAISHEAQLDEPVWQADVQRIPPNDWPVRVRLSAE